MLILTRKKQDRIHIGEDIIIEVIAIQGDRVRIGVSAPKDIRVDRHEIYAARKAESK
jgi:carbon storage regulator